MPLGSRRPPCTASSCGFYHGFLALHCTSNWKDATSLGTLRYVTEEITGLVLIKKMCLHVRLCSLAVHFSYKPILQMAIGHIEHGCTAFAGFLLDF